MANEIKNGTVFEFEKLPNSDAIVDRAVLEDCVGTYTEALFGGQTKVAVKLTRTKPVKGQHVKVGDTVGLSWDHDGSTARFPNKLKVTSLNPFEANGEWGSSA